MKLEKAIEILNQDLTWTYPAKFNDLQDAMKLGSEALKEVKRARKGDPALDGELLPSETEECCKFCGIAHTGIECPDRGETK